MWMSDSPRWGRGWSGGRRVGSPGTEWGWRCSRGSRTLPRTQRTRPRRRSRPAGRSRWKRIRHMWGSYTGVMATWGKHRPGEFTFLLSGRRERNVLLTWGAADSREAEKEHAHTLRDNVCTSNRSADPTSYFNYYFFLPKDMMLVRSSRFFFEPKRHVDKRKLLIGPADHCRLIGLRQTSMFQLLQLPNGTSS